jgi:hypothetical protein
VLVEVAAQAIAAGTIPAFAPGSVARGGFLDQMPDTILGELGALASHPDCQEETHTQSERLPPL